ncbi:MAG: Ig-like domain-containing protein [Gemmatimonadaceae bacterium]|nr:Ig-like domain-containing protein [Gemmatimonadaceae bacterium]
MTNTVCDVRRLRLLATLVLTACGGGGTVDAPPSSPPPVASVSVTPGTANLVPLETTQLTAAVTDTKGGTVTRAVSWSSSSQTVATVSANGLVSAVAPGQSTITATLDGQSGTAVVTVAEGGSVSPAGGTIVAAGGAITLVIPAGAVPAKVAVSVNPISDAVADPEGYWLAGGVRYQLGPNGTQFAQPVTVTIRYDQTALPPWALPGDLTIQRWNGTQWQPLSNTPGDLDAGSGQRESGASFGGIRRHDSREQSTLQHAAIRLDHDRVERWPWRTVGQHDSIHGVRADSSRGRPRFRARRDTRSSRSQRTVGGAGISHYQCEGGFESHGRVAAVVVAGAVQRFGSAVRRDLRSCRQSRPGVREPRALLRVDSDTKCGHRLAGNATHAVEGHFVHGVSTLAAIGGIPQRRQDHGEGACSCAGVRTSEIRSHPGQAHLKGYRGDVHTHWTGGRNHRGHSPLCGEARSGIDRLGWRPASGTPRRVGAGVAGHGEPVLPLAQHRELRRSFGATRDAYPARDSELSGEERTGRRLRSCRGGRPRRHHSPASAWHRASGRAGGPPCHRHVANRIGHRDPCRYAQRPGRGPALLQLRGERDECARRPLR